MGIQRSSFLTRLSEGLIEMPEGIGLADAVFYRPVSKVERPLVAILLCTLDGASFLREQIDSIQKQDHENLIVFASDDGSTDSTNLLLKQFQSRLGKDRVSIKSGPQRGFAANFLSLICQTEIEANYYAYADQDDEWRSDKLSRALDKLENVPKGRPALYCSRTSLIDENGDEIGFSPLFDKPPGFANALVQNIGGGNTMVMNQVARNLLCQASDNDVVSHDWWAYLIISGAGGTIFYDSYPSVRYRQHADNLVGSNVSWSSRLLRLRMLLKGSFRKWSTINTQALQKVRHLLTTENQAILDKFCTARDRWIIPRLLGIWRSGVYRQTLLGNMGLIAASILKKI